MECTIWNVKLVKYFIFSDKEPPTFQNCINLQPVAIERYGSLQLETPLVTDNSGGILRLGTDIPLNATVKENMNITWTADDFSGNTATCQITVLVAGKDNNM